MEKVKLYKHNEETYEKIKKEFNICNKVAVIQATGTGKGYLILKYIQDNPNINKIILAPSNYILEQMQNEANSELPNTKLFTYKKIVNMTHEQLKDLKADFIALDEFHRCGAKTWRVGINKLIDIFPNAKVLGTSATPIRYLDNQRDMSDEIFNGNIVTKLSLTEAIVKNILPMPKYIYALFTLEDEFAKMIEKIGKSKNNKNDKIDLLKKLDKLKNNLDKSRGVPQILNKYINKNEDKFIVFCKDKTHQDKMIKVVDDWFLKSGITKSVKNYILYSNFGKRNNTELNRFKNDNSSSIKLLFSINMLNEGIHLEDISGVILLRPTISKIIFSQQIGRAIQTGNNKQPLIFDFVNNSDSVGGSSFFNDLKETYFKLKETTEFTGENFDLDDFMIYDEVKDVLDLFMDFDDKLINDWDYMYEILKKYKFEFGNCDVPRRLHYKNVYLGNWVATQRKLYKNNFLAENRMQLLSNICFSWNISDIKWNYMFKLIKEYIDEFSNCCVPQGFIYKKETLGEWVITQRKSYKNNKLDTNKIKQLTKIGFVWNSFDESWNHMYELLKEYKKDFGDLNIPLREKYKEEALGSWVVNQRTHNKNKTISEDRIKKLNEIDFIWDTLDNNWHTMFKLLEVYISKFGLNNINQKLKYGDKNLGTWISNQQNNYKRGNLNQSRIDKLKNLNIL